MPTKNQNRAKSPVTIQYPIAGGDSFSGIEVTICTNAGKLAADAPLLGRFLQMMLWIASHEIWDDAHRFADRR